MTRIEKAARGSRRALTAKMPGGGGLTAAILGGAAALGALAVSAHLQAERAERTHPPTGRFIEVEGARLHYVDRGEGEPLVLLHGNGALIGDLEVSGLLGLAARRYRAIAFDRPGFGHSTRPRDVIWSPDAQADLLVEALRRLGIGRFLLLGHSWGAMVAAALALRHPDAVAGLVLVSGYYYPTARLDAPLAAGPAIPGIGDALRYTVSPLVARATWPALTRKIFGPDAVPDAFDRVAKEMAMRPSQIRASAAESALMIPGAIALHEHYGELAMPVAVVAGRDDRLIDPNEQSVRLAGEVPGATLKLVPSGGHMVHHTAPADVMAALDDVARRARPAGG